MQHLLPWLCVTECPFQLKCTFNGIPQIRKEPKLIQAIYNGCQYERERNTPFDMKPPFLGNNMAPISRYVGSMPVTLPTRNL